MVILATLTIGVGTYLYFFKKYAGPITNTISRSTCLGDSEFVDYTIDKKYATEIRIPTSPVTVFIREKESNRVKWSFVINNIVQIPPKIFKCSIYITRKLDTNSSGSFRDELWQYDYSGNGIRVFTLAVFKNKKTESTTYSQVFNIDPQEKYLTLERSYLGRSDYGLVIKDLKTLNDLFILTHEKIREMDPSVSLGIIANGIQRGGLDIGRWTSDNRFLWGTMFNGALDTAYFRIEMGTWKTEVFSPPPDIPSGGERAISFAGHLAYADFPTFFGIDIIAQQEQKRFRKEGRVKHLYLYGLRTKEKKLLATTTDPTQRFNIKWLSDTELQYELPSGEKKVYKIR